MVRNTAKQYNADSEEQKELISLAKELAKNEQGEDNAWKIKTDTAAFGRERIDIPERWD